MESFNLKGIEDKINIHFDDQKVLLASLTHSSYAKQYKNTDYNERLEFLGDSVLQLTMTEYLFKRFNKKTEGELTKLRSLVVCENSLYEVSRVLELYKYIRMSRGEELTGGRERVSIQADAVEALIAAIYLDKGLETAKNFIFEYFGEIIEKAINHKIILDFKTELQEYLQKDGEVEIRYEVSKFDGPPHRRKFYMNLLVADKLRGTGVGYSKKEAEQNAAKEALKDMGAI